MSIFNKKIPSPKKEKIGFKERIKGIGRGLKERVSKSPAVSVAKAAAKAAKRHPTILPNKPALKQYKSTLKRAKKEREQYNVSTQRYQEAISKYPTEVEQYKIRIAEHPELEKTLARPRYPEKPHKPKTKVPEPPPSSLFHPEEEMAQHYPAKQIKKTIVGAGHLIASQDRPFSSIVKSAGFGGRGGGRSRRSGGGSTSRKPPSLKAWGEEGVDL